MKRKVLVHLGISQLYFWVVILMSWNKSGGDIFAILFVFVFFLIHLLVVLIKMIRHRQQQHYLSLTGLIFSVTLHVLSFYLLTEYRVHKHEAAGGDRVLME